MVMRRLVPLVLFGLSVAVAAQIMLKARLPENLLPTGKEITPIGSSVNVGSYPVNMTLTPDGRYVLVTDSGFRQQLSVLSTESGELVSKLEFNKREGDEKQALYFGLAAHAGADGRTHVAVSRGSQDRISLYALEDGDLKAEGVIDLPRAENPLKIPNHVAGVAWSPDGSRIYAVGNQSHAFNNFQGTLYTFDLTSHALLDRSPVGSFPLDVLCARSGVFVANEGGSEVSVLGRAPIRTGQGPTYLSANHAGNRVFVSNSGSDTISVIHLPDQQVERTVLLRPADLRGLPGVTPLGSCVSPDDRTLFVAMGDLNAIAVVDIGSGTVKGYMPTGWYPTSVVCSSDGKRLFVANAKGVRNQNPNGRDVHGLGTYGPNILEGTVSVIDLDAARQDLASSTVRVLRNNGLPLPLDQLEVVWPPIDHLVYIIKENRTYDQVFGDLPSGNGDPSLTLFGKDVTPNQHALAQRFALFDNFYVCAEVSADGWQWSTSGTANQYTERNTPYNYSGRGRNYDFEGTNNGSPVKLSGRRDVAEPAGGYVWDAFMKKGLSVRNYGMFNSFGDDTKSPDGKPIAEDNRPSQPALVRRTCVDFRDFDMAFADSEAWVKLGLKPAPRQMTAYGSHRDPSRISTWLREFNGSVKNGDLPTLTLLRLPRNHTSGTSAGLSSPKAMVADNDYAVGQVVEAISHSPYWKRTAIFIVEDDAQAGTDHIDCHRSPVLVISPFVRHGMVDSSFYNTDSVLATMEALVGVSPQNQYLLTARRMRVFEPEAANDAPFEAIMPDRGILAQVNSRNAYRSGDSDRLLSRFQEESGSDLELNDILWTSIKGTAAPHPRTPGAVWGLKKPDR